jgi:hypothetical protein
LVQAYVKFDNHRINCSGASDTDNVWRQMDRISQRQFMIEDSITAMRATTLAGALVHVIRASSIATRINDQLPVRDTKEGEEIETLFRQLDSVLYSAVGVLSDLLPGEFEASGGDFYMPKRCNPFRVLEESEKTVSEIVPVPTAA